MEPPLFRIKRAILAGQYEFSRKATLEMNADGLSELDVLESIINAVAIYKRIRSRSSFRKEKREYLYVILSSNLVGLPIYTKGKLVPLGAQIPSIFSYPPSATCKEIEW